MPKEVVVIDKFHGGQDSNSDPRDIAFEDSVEITNIESSENLDTDKKGKLKLSGGFVATSATVGIIIQDDGDYTERNLQELFMYGSDYCLISEGNETSQIADPAIDDEIEYKKPILVPVRSGTQIKVYDTSADAYMNGDYLDFNDYTEEEMDPYDLDPIYYYSEGGLVIGNSNFNAPEVEPLMLKLVRRTMMQHTNSEQYINEWYTGLAKPDTPEDILNIGGDLANPEMVSMEFGPGSGNNMMTSLMNTWEFGVSYQVDEFEETDIVLESSGFVYDMNNTSGTDSPFIKISLNASNIVDTYGLRTTKIRIYMRVTNSEDWYILASVDLKKATFTMPTWNNNTMDLIEVNEGVYHLFATGETYPAFGILPLENYYFYSGRDPGDTQPVQYKTLVISGKRAWIGHIKQDGIVYGDRMLKSAVRQYNVFPEDNWIDVVVDDGDDIIKLEAFADRILQFKRSTLYIINAPPQGGEFLEAQYPGYGLDYPSASTLTPNGVVFANTQGIYLYDSEKISNLLIQGKVSKVSKEEWKSFSITTADDGTETNKVLRVGFDPKDDIVHVYNPDFDGYRISLINNSISSALKPEGLAGSAGQIYSNFFTFRNKLYSSIRYTTMYGLQHLSDTPKEAYARVITRDFDLGEPSIRKKVYRIWVTYKSEFNAGAGTGMFLHFATNGSTTFSRTYSSSTSTYTDTSGRLKGTAGEWKQVWFKLQSSDGSNIYSIQLKISSEDSATTDANTGLGKCVDEHFEIDDISLVLRRKRAK